MPSGGRSEPVTQRLTERQWEEVHCRTCKRLLCKTTGGSPLRSAEAIEIKCAKCNALNYLMGRPEGS
jgi:hypothetical protein